MMEFQQSYNFTATPQGILLDGRPLQKSDFDDMSESGLRHMLCAFEWMSQMTEEDWGLPKPLRSGETPKLAMAQINLAMIKRDVLVKYNPNHDDKGRFAPKAGQLGSPAPASAKEGKDVATRYHNTRQMNRFFDLMDARLSRVSDELGLPHDYLLGLSAYESGHLDNDNLALNNPLGLTHAGGPNIKFDSLDSAVSYWKKLYGNRVRGATSPEDFAQRLQGKINGIKQPGWIPYNSENPHWASKAVDTIKSIGKRRAIWQCLRAEGEDHAQ